MHFSLLADYEIDRITALTPEWLEAHGIRLLLLDFDNTIVPYTTSEPTEEFLHWKEQLAHAGISMMVVSNSRKSRRVPDFCEKWDIPWIRHAGKPNPKGIRSAMERMGQAPAHTAMAGIRPLRISLGEIWQGSHQFWSIRCISATPFSGFATESSVRSSLWDGKNEKDSALWCAALEITAQIG